MSGGLDVRPHVIDVADEVLADLHERLDRTRWPDAETVDDWSQGIPLAVVQRYADHWRHGYNWRAREVELNRLNHFMATVQGIDIHFIHQRSPHPEATPLVITHGWPGSVLEFLDVIGPLVDPVAHGGRAEDAFHVVCPSLPGFGFSGKPIEVGWGVEKIADVWAELMAGLGYERFGAQGGDWGGVVTSALAERHFDLCIGIHLNLVIGARSDPAVQPTEAARKAIAAHTHYRRWDSGYSTQQRTRPQTLGYGLTDSPVGQLAWILEKFHFWTGTQGGALDSIDRDRLLDNVMVYWCNAAATSSARLYWESFGNYRPGTIEVPTGVAAFPGEILPTAREWVEPIYTDIRHWTEMPRGGHFAALEQPELFVDDVRAFFALI